jgi:hypothetical protein
MITDIELRIAPIMNCLNCLEQAIVPCSDYEKVAIINKILEYLELNIVKLRYKMDIENKEFCLASSIKAILET